jgi:hypothetical protein
MRKTFTQLAVLLLCAGVSSCRPVTVESSRITVVPGLGIPGLLQVGMTTQQVRNRARDLVVRKLEYVGTYAYAIPSLGVQWHQETETDKLYELHFLTNPDVFTNGLSTDVGTPFRGNVAGGLSFRSATSVDRTKVLAVFGEPSVIYDIRAGPPFPPTIINMAWRTNTSSMAVLTGANSEVLYYPARGINFGLDHGVVFNFSIYPKAEPTGGGS